MKDIGVVYRMNVLGHFALRDIFCSGDVKKF